MIPFLRRWKASLLGLADRVATIAEMFAVGLEPSGSKDPFALRRAANGVIKILAESGLPLTIEGLESLALETLPRAGKVGAFLKERLDFYLREVRGYSYDVVNAVLSTGLTTVADAIARAQALTDVRGSEDLAAISTAFKRIKNILRQAEEKQEGQSIKAEDLIEPAEQQLYAEVVTSRPPGGGSSRATEISRGSGEDRYTAARDRQLFRSSDGPGAGSSSAQESAGPDCFCAQRLFADC